MSGKKSKWLGDLSKTTLPIPSIPVDGAIYVRWLGIFSRCYGQCKPFRPYAKHNIKVAEEWHGIEGYYRFKDWSLSHGFRKDLCLDRIDGYGDYSPQNCRWVTKAENCYNRVDAFMVEIDGEKRRFVDLCRENNISYSTARARISAGVDIKQALTMPVRKRTRRESDGDVLPLAGDCSGNGTVLVRCGKTGGTVCV